MKPKKNMQEKPVSDIQTPQTQYSYQPQEQIGGESVHVALRLRPLNAQQLQREDSNCFKIIDQQNCQLLQKNGQVLKNFRFNYLLDTKTKQAQMYDSLPIDDYISSALDGYSVTIFAYGQTGSGKTYTMAGVEEKLSQQVFRSDETDGIIPRAIKNLWNFSQKKKDKYSIKASFTQIYNQQIKDLLNPTSGVLHCRWNPANGFFVEDLIIVDCTSMEDLIAVLNQGIKNRKSGSHELNKDSSRSHSIMTIYAVSQTDSLQSRSVKRYGKMSFVDLAGSQRLKQSKSQGQMAKQTGNINKSLFTLGKVIKALSDKKTKIPYIPYRDSKLTMLLMDSLGGTSKALMIACASPSSTYFDETLSTLNYATRTMNIKNKPVIQMQEKDQIIYGLMRQRDLLRLENQYLRQQIDKASSGKLQIPKIQTQKKALPPLSKGNKQASTKPMSLPKPNSTNNSKKQPNKIIKEQSSPMKKSGLKGSASLIGQLSPNVNDVMKMSQQQKQKQHRNLQIQISLNKVIQEYQFEMSRLQIQNTQLKNARQVAEKNYLIVANDNNALQIKLQNLQQLFIKNSNTKKNINQEYMNSNLVAQNKMIKQKIENIQDEIFELREKKNKMLMNSQNMSQQERQLRVNNKNLKDRVQFLKKRQTQLVSLLSKKKK